MNMNEYNDIRHILSRWYDGISTPAEQQRLVEFFAEERDLPADLAMERELFRAMTEADMECAEMPAEVSERINTALEAEMMKERKPRSKFSGRYWRVISACSAAACIAAVFMIPFLKPNDKGTTEDKVGMAVTESPAIKPASTDTMHLLTPELPQAVAPAAVGKESKKLASANKTGKHHAIKHKPVETDIDEELYLSEEEEERLIAANYHVVTDEREANAILGSVFVRLESSLAEERYLISDVTARYEMEMNDILDL